jgi:RNA polymerase sigma factor (TIGR02999 family)
MTKRWFFFMPPQFANFPLTGPDEEDLVRQLYAELKRMARGKLALERPGHTLNATALVHEAWLRLEKSTPAPWRDQNQFFAAASEAMRRILVEAARRRLAAKRGAGRPDLPLEELPAELVANDERFVEVHEVLDDLAKEDALKAEIVKLRFFTGLEHEEIAAILGVSERTVRRHWQLAKIWLFRAISRQDPAGR